MITLKLAGQIVDLEGDEVIACSYSIFPIGNISKRSAFKSVEFQLPMTANNKEIIENNQIIVNNSILPFQFIPATLEADGVDQKIISAQLVSIKDTIKIRLFGGNIDFYNLIKDLKLRDLDLSDLDHVWDLSLLAWRNLRFNTSGVIYPVVDFHADSPNAFVDNITSQINARYMYPAIFRHTLIRRIIEGVGFTLQGDFLSNSEYLSTLIQTVTTNYNDELLTVALLDATTVRIQDGGQGTPEQYDLAVEALGGLGYNYISAAVLNFANIQTDVLSILQTRTIDYHLQFLDPAIFTIEQGITYLVPIDGDYDFEIQIDFETFDYYSLGNQLRLYLVKHFPSFPGAIEITYVPVQIQIPARRLLKLRFTATLVRGDIVYAVARINGVPDIVNRHFVIYNTPETYFKVVSAPESYSYGNFTSLSSNLPDISQSDFLLDTIVKFGLILQIDNDNKVVKFRQFSEIIANKPNAKDWSDKVDYSEKPDIKFDSEYAQINEYKYTDDETVVKPPGTDYELVINNQLLPPRKTIFQSKFAATEKVVRFIGKEINRIKLISGAGTTNQDENSIKPRELILARQDFVLTVVDGSASTTWSTEIPTTRFIKDGEAFNLGFGNLLPRFSGDIIALVQDFRTSVQLLRLNTLDINQLDFFIPVWIERNGEPGCYFYISEINQFKFTSVESVDVELCKLP